MAMRDLWEGMKNSGLSAMEEIGGGIANLIEGMKNLEAELLTGHDLKRTSELEAEIAATKRETQEIKQQHAAKAAMWAAEKSHFAGAAAEAGSREAARILQQATARLSAEQQAALAGPAKNRMEYRPVAPKPGAGIDAEPTQWQQESVNPTTGERRVLGVQNVAPPESATIARKGPPMSFAPFKAHAPMDWLPWLTDPVSDELGKVGSVRAWTPNLDMLAKKPSAEQQTRLDEIRAERRGWAKPGQVPQSFVSPAQPAVNVQPPAVPASPSVNVQPPATPAPPSVNVQSPATPAPPSVNVQPPAVPALPNVNVQSPAMPAPPVQQRPAPVQIPMPPQRQQPATVHVNDPHGRQQAASLRAIERHTRAQRAQPGF
jgi:hypothetical protein